MAERIERDTDTIYACATAQGEGAIAVMRVSGPRSLEAVGAIFRTHRNRTHRSWRSHRVVHGFVVEPETERRVDEVLVLHMACKRSFTGEDLVEIHCHGSGAVIRAVGKLLAKQGLREAQPGEFTRRAFLSGRVSLDEAEAIAELIRARSEEAALITVENLTGALRTKIETIRAGLLSLLALLEANVDFPEDDVDPATRGRVEHEIETIAEQVAELARSFERGRLLREGIRVVLAGQPNVGKSSLMNALLRSDRSIVTEIPGTTRDTIEETVNFQGLGFVLIDTAGLCETSDPVERLGVERTHGELRRADLTLLLLDATIGVTSLELNMLGMLRERDACHVLVANKVDAAPRDWKNRIGVGLEPIPVSALLGVGVEELMEHVHGLARQRLVRRVEGPMVSNERHRDCLLHAGESLTAFREGLSAQVPLDVCLVDLYEAANHLGAITGEIVNNEILDAIFSRFCIGK